MVLIIAGDRWWPATLVLFGPRWLVVPLLVLIFPLAVFITHRLLVLVIIALFIAIGPFMGFTLSLVNWGTSNGKTLRVLSCNLNSGKFDPLGFQGLVENIRPDIIALQECPRELSLTFKDRWYIIRDGQLTILSRYPIEMKQPLQSLHPPHTWPRTTLLPCIISTPFGLISFCNVHLPSPRYGLQNIVDRNTIISFKRKALLISETAYRRAISNKIAAIAASLPSPKIIAGDFNMPVDSSIYRDNWHIYQNAFSKRGFGYGWTEWASFHGVKIAVRIDHILLDNGWTPKLCEVGPDVGSDHLPIIADIVPK